MKRSETFIDDIGRVYRDTQIAENLLFSMFGLTTL